MILDKKNLQNLQSKSYIELIVLFVHPKNGNHAPLITLDYVWKTNSSQTKYPSHPPTPPLFYRVNWTAPKYNFKGQLEDTIANLHALLCLKGRPKFKIRPDFLYSTSLLYKILPTNVMACKPAFYTFYTSHMR